MKINKSSLFNILKVLLSFLLIYLLFRNVDFQEIMNVIKEVGINPFIISFGCYFLTHLFNSFKWCKIIDSDNVGRALALLFKAQLFSIILPGQSFGEASKVVMLKNEGIDPVKSISSIIADKALGFTAIMIYGLFGVLFSSKKLPSYIYVIVFIIILFLLIAYTLPRFAFFNRFVEMMVGLFKKLNISIITKIIEGIYRIYNNWKDYVTSNSRILISLLFALLANGFGVLQTYGVGKMLNINVEITDYMWIYMVISIAIFIPFFFGGLGIREASLVGMLSLYGIANEKSLTLSIIIFFAQLMGALIGGILLLVEKKK